VRFAVAYWGAGTVARLGIPAVAERDVQIVCDLLSGACNPCEVRRLRSVLGNGRVLTHDRLHAKVWWTDRGALIGSSNASANGLALEGGETSGLVEANLLVTDPPTLTAVELWLGGTVLPEAREITEADLERAEALWKARRTARPMRGPAVGTSLLEALRVDPDLLRDRRIAVWAYEHDGLDDWAEAELEAEREARGQRGIYCWQNVDKPYPEPGTHIIEFDVKGKSKARFDGIYQILRDVPVRRSKKGVLVFCRRVRGIEGLGIPPAERKAWQEAAVLAADSAADGEWEGDVGRFAREYLFRDKAVR
jgi:hypothetical protein